MNMIAASMINTVILKTVSIYMLTDMGTPIAMGILMDMERTKML
jgi:hypothetical protein